VGNEAKYKIEFDRGTKGTQWKDITEIYEDEGRRKKDYCSFTLGDLNPGRKYLVRVGLFNERGELVPARPTPFSTFAEDTKISIDLLKKKSSRDLNKMNIQGNTPVLVF